MTELEIEKEIQARMEFKMGEILTSIKNRLGFKHNQAWWDMSQRSQDIWKSFEEVSQVVKKEMELPTPVDNMSQYNKRKAKDVAVDKLVQLFELDTKGHNIKRPNINKMVSIIEDAQNY